MDYQGKFNTNEYAEFLQTMVKLDEIQKMTDNLGQELKESQNAMNEIKSIFTNIPTDNRELSNSGLRHEDISQFLAADVPNLLLSDMIENTNNIDLDNLISTMKTYVEDLKKNCTVSESNEKYVSRSIDALDLAPYASSLDQLAKQIGKMKLSNNQEANRNEELEQKLIQLCQDVNLFTQMVEAKTKLSESNKDWVPVQQDTDALGYDNIISKLLSGINEVTYLLNNRN